MRVLLASLGVASLLILAPYMAWAQGSNSPQSSGMTRHVVAIYDKDDDHKLLGSGALVSTTGLILTAKHILTLEKLAWQASPNLRVVVQVRADSNATLYPAELLAVHPVYDLAVLKVDWPLKHVPLFVGGPSLEENWQWTAIGHNTGGAQGVQLFFEKSGSSDELTGRAGRWVIDRFVATGMSGGPLIAGNTVIGVISFADTAAYIEPVAPALEYFSLVGVVSTPSGDQGLRRTMKDENHIGALANKVRTYEKLLNNIQLDQEWYCRLDTTDPIGNAQLVEQIDFRVGHRKRLDMQPDIDASVTLQVQATLENPYDESVELELRDSEWKEAGQQELNFPKFLGQIKSKLSQTSARPLESFRLTRLEAHVHVTGMWSDDLIAKEPGEVHRCCVFELPNLDGENTARVCPQPDQQSAGLNNE